MLDDKSGEPDLGESASLTEEAKDATKSSLGLRRRASTYGTHSLPCAEARSRQGTS